MQETPGRAQRWTIGELLRWTVDRFEAIGIANPRVDAEHLLAHALACQRVDLYLMHDRLVELTARAGFRELVRRRIAREPVAYIEGRRGFHALDLDLLVDPRVLIPRPETEHLVDWVLETIPADCERREVLDVGTGSGAIALAIVRARPRAHVCACDVSTAALEVAAANARRHGLEIDLRHSDLLASLEPPDGGWDVIAANLPYIATADLPGLAPEVSHFEPRCALDGGPEGVTLIDALLTQIADRGALRPGGSVFLEIGAGQAQRVAARMAESGLVAVERRRDLAGIERVVRGQRPPG